MKCVYIELLSTVKSLKWSVKIPALVDRTIKIEKKMSQRSQCEEKH